MPVEPAPVLAPGSAADSALSRKQRALVAHYALAAGTQSREAVLRLNNVSEADLADYKEEWQLLRSRNRTT